MIQTADENVTAAEYGANKCSMQHKEREEAVEKNKAGRKPMTGWREPVKRQLRIQLVVAELYGMDPTIFNDEEQLFAPPEPCHVSLASGGGAFRGDRFLQLWDHLITAVAATQEEIRTAVKSLTVT